MLIYANFLKKELMVWILLSLLWKKRPIDIFHYFFPCSPFSATSNETKKIWGHGQFGRGINGCVD